MKTPLFVTSVEKAAGKTLVTLGLVSHFGSMFDNVGFIKPVGVARVRAGRDGIDLDAMLVDKLHMIHENIKDMCPVTLGTTVWPEVREDESERMLARIRDAFARVCDGRDIVVVEGSGGATLLSSMGLGNTKIAKMLGCRALLVASYGVLDDNPFDRILLHRDHLLANGVECVGAIVNQVPADQLAAYRTYAGQQFDKIGVEMVGCVPEEPRLRAFSFLTVTQHLDGEMLCNPGNAERRVGTVRIGAMTPHRAIPYFVDGSLIITPGDREDIIVTVCACASGGSGPTGLVLTGDQRPHDRILELLASSGIPTFLAREDSYTVASKIHDMPIRIQPTDVEKISLVQSMVADHIDIDRVVEQL